MTSRLLGAAGLAAAIGAIACGPRSGGNSTGPDVDANFDCSSRRAEYMVVGSMAAKEAGVSFSCDNNVPLLTVWRQNPDSPRYEREHPMSSGQFEATWEQIDSTGWRFLQPTCPGSSDTPGDPVYVINVSDHATSVNLTCTGKELPFPYDRLVNELDLRAAGFQ